MIPFLEIRVKGKRVHHRLLDRRLAVLPPGGHRVEVLGRGLTRPLFLLRSAGELQEAAQRPAKVQFLDSLLQFLYIQPLPVVPSRDVGVHMPDKFGNRSLLNVRILQPCDERMTGRVRNDSRVLNAAVFSNPAPEPLGRRVTCPIDRLAQVWK